MYCQKRTFARPFDDKPSRRAVARPFGLRLLQSTFLLFFEFTSTIGRQTNDKPSRRAVAHLSGLVCVRISFSPSIYPCRSTLSRFRVKVIRYDPAIHSHPLTSNPSLSLPKFLSRVLRSSGIVSPFLSFSPSFQLTAGPALVYCISLQ